MLRHFCHLLIFGLAIVSAIDATAQPAANAKSRGCVILVSQGRNLSTSEAAANEKWNKLNDAIGKAVSDELAQTPLEVIWMALPVETNDPREVRKQVFARVKERHCNEILSSSIYGLPADDQVVAELRAYPVERNEETGELRLGKEALLKIQSFPFRSTSLDRVTPGEVGVNLARAYIGHAGLVRR